MEDLPTLHGPKNKTMGLEVISPSAQMWINTNSKTGQEKKKKELIISSKMLWLLGSELFTASSNMRGNEQSQSSDSVHPRFHSWPQAVQAAQIPVFQSSA